MLKYRNAIKTGVILSIPSTVFVSAYIAIDCVCDPTVTISAGIREASFINTSITIIIYPVSANFCASKSWRTSL